MRAWLAPRTILIALLLVVAPAAALAHLLLTWVPARIAVAQVNGDVSRDAQQLDVESQEEIRLQKEWQGLQRATASTAHAARWLPQRDRDLVFDRLAGAFQVDRVALERLTLAEPGLYCAARRSNLLACERVTVRCVGDYASLSNCLDRLANLDLPMRVTHLTWGRGAAGLTLGLEVEVPFIPDQTLAKTLADAAGLEEKTDAP